MLGPTAQASQNPDRMRLNLPFATLIAVAALSGCEKKGTTEPDHDQSGGVRADPGGETPTPSPSPTT